MKGVYIIFLRLKEEKIVEIGALGEISFEPGIYAYVGSAMNSLESRVGRHFSDEKNLHWHIDYFTEAAEVFAFTGLKTSSDWECILAETAIEKSEPVKHFGSSDCGCKSHLFRISDLENAPEVF